MPDEVELQLSVAVCGEVVNTTVLGVIVPQDSPCGKG